MKKTIKIKFVDFWDNFNYENFILYKKLKAKYNVIISDEPEYLIFCDHGYDHLKYNDCVRIYYTLENMIPNFNQCDYALGFHYIDFEDRYMRLPIFLAFDNYYDLFKIAKEKHLNNTKIKPNFCNMVVSNGLNSYRLSFYKKLNNYKSIDSGGKILNNVGGPVPDKLEFQKNYKFSFAFENSSSNGYTTEKIVDAFAAGGIPIYWGDPLISKVFNPKSFINAKDFKTDEELIDYIRKIDNDDKLYLKYIKEPMLIDKNLDNNTFKKLDEFIQNIFDKDINEALRRCDENHWVQMEKKYYLLSDKIVKLIKPLLKLKASIKNKFTR